MSVKAIAAPATACSILIVSSKPGSPGDPSVAPQFQAADTTMVMMAAAIVAAMAAITFESPKASGNAKRKPIHAAPAEVTRRHIAAR